VIVDPANGQFGELRSVQGQDFGQTYVPGQIIGKYGMPPGVTPEEFLPKRAELYADLDALLPAFAASQQTLDGSTLEAAKEFKELFNLLAEPPLMPFYHVVGREFFQWLDQVAP
jgi:hypothetical protein